MAEYPKDISLYFIKIWDSLVKDNFKLLFANMYLYTIADK